MDERTRDHLKKMKEFYELLVKWVSVLQQGRSPAETIRRRGYKRVSIYGMKEIGLLLYDEIDRADIEITYVVDRNADYLDLDIEADIYAPDDKLPDTDVMIVTAIHYWDEIRQDLGNKVDCDIVSIQELIDQA